MKTIEKNVTAQLTEKKSKFIANIYYVTSVKEVEEKLLEVRKKYHDAKHNCFAYRIQNKSELIEKSSDDGEPSGTAGAPILNLLSKSKLVNVLVVVTRYFGGILLGTGGLVRVYSQVTKDVIESCKFVEEKVGLELEVHLTYQDFALLEHYCKMNEVNIQKVQYEDIVKCILEATLDEKRKIEQEIEKKRFNVKKMEIVKEKNIRKNIEI